MTFIEHMWSIGELFPHIFHLGLLYNIFFLPHESQCSRTRLAILSLKVLFTGKSPTNQHDIAFSFFCLSVSRYCQLFSVWNTLV